MTLSELICISEHRGDDVDQVGARTVAPHSPKDPSLRVIIDRALVGPGSALLGGGQPPAPGQRPPDSQVPEKPRQARVVHPSLGNELCILYWAVEDAPLDDIPSALKNWEALAPEELWWLYTMTVATTGQALQRGIGWRKALRAALADNPFVKG